MFTGYYESYQTCALDEFFPGTNTVLLLVIGCNKTTLCPNQMIEFFGGDLPGGK